MMVVMKIGSDSSRVHAFVREFVCYYSLRRFVSCLLSSNNIYMLGKNATVLGHLLQDVKKIVHGLTD
jgi:hypothetical protein